MAQVGALVWLRFRLLLGRTGSPALGRVVQGIVFFFMICGAVGIYLVFLLLYRALPRPAAVQALYVELALVWGAWLVFPLMGVSFDDSTDLSKLMLYPLSPRQMALGMLLSDLVSAPAGFTVLLAVPMGWTRHAAQAPVTIAAVALLAVHVVALVESLRIALWDLLRSRRTRDWLILLTPFIGVAVYVAQSVALRGVMLGGPAKWLTLQPSHYLQFLPSGLAAGAVADAAAGRYGPSLAYLAGLLGLAAATVAVMAQLVRRVQAGEADFARAWREAPRERRPMRRGVALPLSEAVATVARKDLLLFRRDPQLKIQVIQAAVFPIIWVVLSVLWSPGGFSGAPWTGGLFVAAMGFMLLGAFMLSANAFGFEGEAASMLFLFPAPRRAVLAGKNLALWTVLMAVYTPALILLAALSGQWAALPLAWVGAACALLLSLGIGNFLSIFAPYRLPARRQNPFATRAGGRGCVGFLVSLAGYLATSVLALPLGAALLLPLALRAAAWYWLTVPVAVGYAGWLYRALLGWAARRVQAREPEIIQAVGAKGAG